LIHSLRGVKQTRLSKCHQWCRQRMAETVKRSRNFPWR
jgi:hypothetical protein